MQVIRSSSSQALPGLAAEGFRCDFVYVDGSHRAADVLLDLCGTWPLLNPEGVCICDDFLWQAGADVLASPKIAIDAFTTIFTDRIQLIRSRQNFQVGFVKRVTG